MRPFRFSLALSIVLLLAPACGGQPQAPPPPVSPQVRALCDAALERTERVVRYDGSYVRLEYPGGDVPDDRGVCTDVIVRSYRNAFGLDLQQVVHEDMRSSFAEYPNRWGLVKPDHNIDHRRVPNLETFWRRQGAELPVSRDAGDYLPGDLVTWDVAGRPHVGLVVDRRSPDGRRPMVVHNIGAGTRLENMLFDFPVTGHFRWLPED